MDKRRILVISYYYAPQRNIASLRWSKLVKYITAKGWEADVLASSSIEAVDGMLAGEFSRLGNIIYIDHKLKGFAPSQRQKELLEAVRRGEFTVKEEPDRASGGVSVPIKERTGLSALKHRIGMSAPVQLYGRLMTNSEHMKMSKDFARQAEKYIRDSGGLDKYDAVVATYGPLGDVFLALRLKKLYPDTPLIMDFRDQMDGIALMRNTRKKYYDLQKEVCKVSDAACSVSNGMAEIISACSGTEINVITNGYDRDDIKGLKAERSDKLDLCYTGSVYTRFHDFNPLWTCIRELADRGDIDLSKVTFTYAGKDGEFIKNGLARYGIESILDYKGVLDRRDSLSLQLGADSVVMCAWNKENSKGILSGKLIEYILTGRPIIALVNGTLGGSDLRSIIENGRFGAVYEAACAEKDRALLRDYILKLYNEKFRGVPSDFSPDRAAADSFDYKVLADRYMTLIENVIEKAEDKKR